MEDQIKELKELLVRASLLVGVLEKDTQEAISNRDVLIEEQRLIIENRNNTISSLIDKIRVLEEGVGAQNEEQDEIQDEVQDEVEIFDELPVDEPLIEYVEDSSEKFDEDIFKRSSRDIHSLYIANSSSPAWMVDKPGPYVQDVRDAISLNDRLLYINDLFDEDVAIYRETLNVINELGSFEEVVNYLSSEFPHWDENSDTVYRLYMTIRRKF